MSNRLLALLATAAVLMFAAGLFLLNGDSSQQSPLAEGVVQPEGQLDGTGSQELVPTPPNNAIATIERHEGSPLRFPNDDSNTNTRVAEDLGPRYVSVARRASDFVTDAALLIVPDDQDDATSEANQAEDLVDGFNEKLEPVKEKFGRQLANWFGPAPTT